MPDPKAWDPLERRAKPSVLVRCFRCGYRLLRAEESRLAEEYVDTYDAAGRFVSGTWKKVTVCGSDPDCRRRVADKVGA